MKAFGEKLQPFRDTLQEYRFLGGASPCYADIYLLSFLLVRFLVLPQPLCLRSCLQQSNPAGVLQADEVGCYPSVCTSP